MFARFSSARIQDSKFRLYFKQERANFFYVDVIFSTFLQYLFHWHWLNIWPMFSFYYPVTFRRILELSNVSKLRLMKTLRRTATSWEKWTVFFICLSKYWCYYFSINLKRAGLQRWTKFNSPSLGQNLNAYRSKKITLSYTPFAHIGGT